MTFSVTLMDPLTRFQGHDIFEVECLKKRCILGTSYYRMLIGNHTSLLNGTMFNDLDWVLIGISKL